MAFTCSPRGVHASPFAARYRSTAARSLAVLVVQSELTDVTGDLIFDAEPTTPLHLNTVVSPPTPFLRPVGNASASAGADEVVDVDALDVGLPSTTTPAHSTVLPLLPSRRSGHPVLRDVAVLSYRRPSDDYVTDYADTDDVETMPPVDGLLAVAVEDSRVFLRQSGLSTRRVHGGGAAARGAPHPAAALPVHAWRQHAAVGEADEEAASEMVGVSARSSTDDDHDDDRPGTQDAARRRGRGNEFLRARGGAADPGSPASSPVPARLYAARWKQEAGVVVEHAGGTLHRIRPRGGALGATVYTSGTHSHCRADFVALSTNTLTLVQSREYGADLAAVQHTAFACGLSANAICVDDWGPHTSVVGFSDGTLRVVDWRVPPRHIRRDDGGDDAVEDGDEDEGGSVVLRTHAPQPPWLRAGRGRRSRGGASPSVAGVLSCCAVHDGVRIVCGLGDASGAVVMTDLRRPEDGGSTAGRRRKRSEVELRQLLFSEVGGHCPTGRAVSDIRADPSSFGRLGLVDVRGDTVVTSVAALERSLADSTTTTTTTGNAAARSVSGAGPTPRAVTATATTTPGAASIPRRDFLALPHHSYVIERLQNFSSLTTQYLGIERLQRRLLSGRGEWEQPEWFRGPMALQPRSRCAFSEVGDVLASTAARGATTATLRHMPLRPLASTAGCAATHVQLGTTAAGGRRPDAADGAAAPFVAVSCVDGLVCFDTEDGQTLAMDVL